MEVDYARWSPADYLTQYYATTGVAEDERGILAFVLEFLLDKKYGFSSMLEVGCGPTIHHAIPFMPYVDKLFMADYVEGNLQAIQQWVYGKGHDWSPYLSGMLAIEGNNSEAAITERIWALKSRIAGLLPCDVLKNNPIGLSRIFPLVTSFYCLECLGQDKDQWRRAMRNVASLVAPKGWFLMSSLHKADKYKVCGKEFPTTNISQQDLRNSLSQSGFKPETISIRVCPCEWADEGFSSILVARAQKE